MNALASELKTFIQTHRAALLAIPENRMLSRPAPGKWSKKEIIGHLVDSAQSNIRRFIVGQYEDEPMIVYDQNKWVTISDYQENNTADLIQLWYLLNLHISRILGNMNEEIARRNCLTPEPHSLEWLANDYLIHLKHHLHQVLELEAVAYP